MTPSRSLSLGLLLAAAGGFAQPPAASAWADPTRPPAAPAAEGGASAPRAARAASAPVAPQLQSLQLGAGQASALVDGRIVQTGDALGSKRIVAIDADGLTLRDANGRSERMLLIPATIAKRDGEFPRPVAALSNGSQGDLALPGTLTPLGGQAGLARPQGQTVSREGRRP
ncbi:MAG TPA: hypothetical protein VGQ91_07045 [Ideonella sp.]|jgi:hypothetical protein|nr:hypothetical protein [Ideonella sp.]